MRGLDVEVHTRFFFVAWREGRVQLLPEFAGGVVRDVEQGGRLGSASRRGAARRGRIRSRLRRAAAEARRQRCREQKQKRSSGREGHRIQAFVSVVRLSKYRLGNR